MRLTHFYHFGGLHRRPDYVAERLAVAYNRGQPVPSRPPTAGGAVGDEQPSDEQQTAAAIRDSKYERWRWQIFAVTWLAYAGLYLTRKSFSVAKVELTKP